MGELLIYVILALLFVGIIFAILFISDAISKRKTEKEKELVERLAPNDIEQIKQALIEHEIPIPSDSDNNYKTLAAYFNALCSYADIKAREAIEKEGKYKYEKFPHATFYIMYNERTVIIPSDFLCQLNKHHWQQNLHATEAGIRYFATSKGTDGIDVKTLINNIKRLDEKSFLKSNFQVLNWGDVIWYLDGVRAYGRMANVGVGAVGGALLLGPIGALAGAVSANEKFDKKTKEINQKMKLVFGIQGGRKWIINTDWESSSFQSDFKFFREVCPDRRGSDIVIKE